jgi:di/tricarboxylate transporter
MVSGDPPRPLVPLSVARVAAVAPLALELARSLGYAPRSRGSAALAFAGLAGYWYFSNVFLTGFATNFFVLALLPAADQQRFGWAGWLLAATPVAIVCLAGAIAALTLLFRPEQGAAFRAWRSADSIGCWVRSHRASA